METGGLREAIAALHAAYDRVDAASIDTLTHPELVTALDRLEHLHRRMPTQSHRMIARLQRDANPRELGARSLEVVLATRLRLSATDAGHRLDDAGDLGPPPKNRSTPTAAASGNATTTHSPQCSATPWPRAGSVSARIQNGGDRRSRRS